MKLIRRAAALSTLAAVMAGGVAFAQHPDDHHPDPHGYVRHDDWHQGGHIAHNDWARGHQIDYRHYHLQPPPHGYQWREVDGNYVLAAIATGAIMTAVVASTVH
ncbi:RcnB family protein [Silvibacterium sp.]|uniref:RcnB family protein n=1 Tax=Silvibacterium sp. TaxID=1964179 RepID=UPI0039E31BB1